jgi:hypothetical protein
VELLTGLHLQSKLLTIALKYKTRVEVHSSLLHHIINYGRKQFCVTKHRVEVSGSFKHTSLSLEGVGRGKILFQNVGQGYKKMVWLSNLTPDIVRFRKNEIFHSHVRGLQNGDSHFQKINTIYKLSFNLVRPTSRPRRRCPEWVAPAAGAATVRRVPRSWRVGAAAAGNRRSNLRVPPGAGSGCSSSCPGSLVRRPALPERPELKKKL